MRKMSMFAVSAAALLALTGCVTPASDTEVADSGMPQETVSQSTETRTESASETETQAESETRAPRRVCRRVEVAGRRVAQRVCD